MNTITSPETIAARSIFLREIEDLIKFPQSPQQLANAVNAHAAYLVWQREGIKENWTKFIKLWSRIE